MLPITFFLIELIYLTNFFFVLGVFLPLLTIVSYFDNFNYGNSLLHNVEKRS